MEDVAQFVFCCLRNRRESMCFFWGDVGRECDGNATTCSGFVQGETHQKKIVDASSVRLNDMKGKVY